MYEIYAGINAGEITAAVFCDLSIGFDCVDDQILLKKNNNINMNAKQWIINGSGRTYQDKLRFTNSVLSTVSFPKQLPPSLGQAWVLLEQRRSSIVILTAAMTEKLPDKEKIKQYRSLQIESNKES